MKPLQQVIQRLIELRQRQGEAITLLAVCPNSAAVLEAAVRVAAVNNMPMLFAATLNQVDRDGGYTGWTPASFVAEMTGYVARYGCRSPLYPCLDHGGPWLKDRHTQEKLPLAQAMGEVKASLSACLQAGYQLLHIDPTVDRSLPAGHTPDVSSVVARTVELIAHVEAERQQMNLPPLAYEVGTEEVHGGLVDFANFRRFLDELRAGLEEQRLHLAWPCFVVAQVGTDLHTTYFDANAARRLTAEVEPSGALLKGHYTDWVENPEAYPASGMGGANVGPEFTVEEFIALQELEARERRFCAHRKLTPAGVVDAIEQAVVASGRWRKWLQADETGKEFHDLTPARRLWLTQTGARYVWTAPGVVQARRTLYLHLANVFADPHRLVIDRVAASMEKYVAAFALFDSWRLLGELDGRNG
jgi:tagatose-1,6-bisphosphate aldolase non-catalytic subunit AgaZ/GatZ